MATVCGRYSLIADLGDLAQRFEFDGDWDAFERSYNIAPTQQVLTVRERAEGEGRQAQFMRWGLVPSWAKDPSIGARMINARAETVSEKPAFRSALRRRRCLILADGFYEWQRVPGSKIKRPMRIILKSGEPFAFAGLWETWRAAEGNVIPSCAIITTTANDLLSPIHDRMPVILDRESESLWLDSSIQDPALLTHLLTPHSPDTMDTHEVSPLINSARNNTPEVMAKVG